MADEDTSTAVVPAHQGGDIEISPVMQEGHLDLKALEQDGAPLTMEELAQIGDRVTAVERNSEWWQGDLLVYAMEHHPDQWENLVMGTGAQDIPKIVLMQITSKVHKPKRRLIAVTDKPNSGLSWSKHTLFNKLVQEDPSLAWKLMKRAAAEGMDHKAINKMIKLAGAVEVEGEQVEAPGPTLSSVASARWTASVPAADGDVLDDIRHDVEQFIRTTLQNKGITPTNVGSSMTGGA